MTDLLPREVAGKVRLRFDFVAESPCIQADLVQVRLVVLNVVANAAEALPGTGGEIVLRLTAILATRADLYSPYLGETPPEGAYVVLEVVDSGCGMEEATLARIFDPCFTTKFTGRGLGLAAVLGIVRGHKGTIQVHSVVGQGTTVRLLFPAADGIGEERRATEPAAREARQGDDPDRGRRESGPRPGTARLRASGVHRDRGGRRRRGRTTVPRHG